MPGGDLSISKFDKIILQIKPIMESDMEDTIQTLLLSMDCSSFGMLDSHMYRSIFLKLCEKEGLSVEAMALVIFFSSIVKDPKRICDAIEALEEVEDLVALEEAKDFMENHTTKYTNRQPNKMFPLVKLPDSFASLATLYTARYISLDHLSIPSNLSAAQRRSMLLDQASSVVINTMHFCNMNIGSELQALNRIWEEKLWTEDIKVTFNKARNSKHKIGEFHEDIYLTRARDKYPFIDVEGNKFRINPINTISELQEYIWEVIYQR